MAVRTAINSQPGAEVFENAPMSKWGWGETGGPYIPGDAKGDGAK